jgi:V8-like Glu-specific endopeptidase/tetratricopeptide (TPR) repeat protein
MSEGDDIKALADEALRRLIIPTAEPVGRPIRYGPYHEAAAVLATFDRSTLNPVLYANSDNHQPGGIEAVLADSKLVVVGQRLERWAIRTDVRRSVLRQLRTPTAIGRALAANPDARSIDDPAQEMFEAYLRGDAPAVESQSARQVTGTLQVVEWLDGLDIIAELPNREAVRRRGDLLALLQPFYDLAGTHFTGRREELARLRAYIGVLPPGSIRERLDRISAKIFNLHEKPPLVIWGAGGLGKSTLVGRFIWEHTTLPHAEHFPWALIDFDRPGMLAEEPLTLLVEAVRQLGIQYPDAHEFCDRIRRQWLEILIDRPPEIKRAMTKSITLKESETASSHFRVDEGRVYLRDFATLLSSLKVETDPFLLVLDTFEQVQYRSEVVVGALGGFLAQFQEHVPRLRTVVVGRSSLEGVAGFPTEEIQLEGFDSEVAQALLAAYGVAPPEFARQVYEMVGASPLSLRLAAEMWRRSDGTGLGNLRTRNLFGLRLQENEIQAQLFARVLDHIHDPDVRQLAYPGLVLRRITSEIIVYVLAEICGVRVDTWEEAHRLFEEMGREVGLVTFAPDGALIYRPDVRRFVLRLLRRLDPDKAREIEQKAVEFYASRADVADRAEEVYHRLSLRQPFEVLNQRWIPGLEPYLVGALDELPVRERAWLATRVGRSLTEEERRQADLEGWEHDANQRVRQLLQRERAIEAVEVLRERTERTPGSQLYSLEAEALERLGKWDESRKLVEAGIQSADGSGHHGLAITLRIRGARVDLHRGDLPAAREKLEDAASLTADGPPLSGLEVGLHTLFLLRAERAGGEGNTDEIAALEKKLHYLFQCISDGEVVEQPTLMAWAAVEVGQTNPDVIRRVLRLNGLAGSRGALHGVALALTAWDATQEPPETLAERVGAPPADSLTERWTRYVLSTPAAALGVAIAELVEAEPPFPSVIISLIKVFEELARDRFVPGDERKEVLDRTETRAQPGREEKFKGLRLSRQQERDLAAALIDAFTRDSLEQMLRYRLERNLESIALSDNLAVTVRQLIQISQAEGWSANLLAAALESNPSNYPLQVLAAEFGLVPRAPELNRRLIDTRYIDVETWRTRLSLIEPQVCSVEIMRGASLMSGTGFLVGPDLLMTAFHLVEDLVVGRVHPHDAVFRFDYKQLTDGVTVAAGTVYRLSDNWLVSSSPHRSAPKTSHPNLGAKALDYALLRLERAAGAEPIGGDRAEPNALPRRWIELSDTAANLEPGSPLVILHYPAGQPLMVTFGSIREHSSDRTHLIYDANTVPGSAGSPCFNASWRLIAMHTGRQMTSSGFGWLRRAGPSFGVPISTIVAHLSEQGLGYLTASVLR